MDYQVLKKAVMNFSTLEVETEAGTKKYKLVVDMNAIARANEILGKDSAVPSSWNGITSVEVAKICWFALKRFHPEVTLDEVMGWFTPETAVQLNNLLYETAFPGIVARLKEIDAKAKSQGESQPNPQKAES